MKRKLLIQIHGYIAVFFLPLALLYAITGAFYILGETGGVVRTDASLESSNIPTTAKEIIPLIEATLNENNWRVPSADEYVRELQDGYLWSSLGESVRVTITEGSSTIALNHTKNTWYKQLVEIHKDHAGKYFSLLGFAFGVGMIIMTISGAIMMLQSPTHKRIAITLVSAGTVITLATWAYTLWFY
ncbi:hypothetical protein NBRC116493_34310 [Aurantivibrio infirmus]